MLALARHVTRAAGFNYLEELDLHWNHFTGGMLKGESGMMPHDCDGILDSMYTGRGNGSGEGAVALIQGIMDNEKSGGLDA